MVDLFADDLEPTQEVFPDDRSSGRTAMGLATAAVTLAPADAAAGGPASAATSFCDAAAETPATAAELAVAGLTALYVLQRSRSIMQAEAIVRNCGIFGLRRTFIDGRVGVMASAKGSAPGTLYSVRVPCADTSSGDLAVQCTCPDYAQRGGLCKHGAALLLVLVPGSGYVAPDSVRTSPTALAVDAKLEPSAAKLEPSAAKLEPSAAKLEPASAKLEPVASPLKAVQLGVAEVKLERAQDLPSAHQSPLHPPPHLYHASAPPSHAASDLLPSPVRAPEVAHVPKRRKLPASFSQRLAAPGSGPVPGQVAIRGGSSPSRGTERLFEDGCDQVQAALLPPPAKRARAGVSRNRALDGGTAERAPTAYQIFLRTAKENGGIAVRWRDLSTEERRPYEEAAAEERMRLMLFEAEREPFATSGRAAVSGLEERVVTGNPFGLLAPEGTLERVPSSLPARPARTPPASLAPGPSPPAKATPPAASPPGASLPAASPLAASLPAVTLAAVATPAATASQAARASAACAPARGATDDADCERSSDQRPISDTDTLRRLGHTPHGLSAQLDLLMFPDDSQEEAMPAATRRAVVAAAAAAVSAAGSNSYLSSAKGSAGASIPVTASATPLAVSQICHDADTAAAAHSQTQRMHSPARELEGIAEKEAPAMAAATPASSVAAQSIPEISQWNISGNVATQSTTSARPNLPAEWHCPHCTLINKASATECDACGATRPSSQNGHQVTPPSARAASPTPRAWTTASPAPAVAPDAPPDQMASAAARAATASQGASARIIAPASTSPARPSISFFDMLKELD